MEQSCFLANTRAVYKKVYFFVNSVPSFGLGDFAVFLALSLTIFGRFGGNLIYFFDFFRFFHDLQKSTLFYRKRRCSVKAHKARGTAVLQGLREFPPHAEGAAAVLVPGRNIGDSIAINGNIYITLLETGPHGEQTFGFTLCGTPSVTARCTAPGAGGGRQRLE